MRLRIGEGTDFEVHRVDGRAINVLAGLWIGDPASPGKVQPRVSPGLDVECEPVHVGIAGAHAEAPVEPLVKVDMIQENDDLWRSYEPALKVDAHGGGVFGLSHVLTGEKVEVPSRAWSRDGPSVEFTEDGHTGS